MSESQEVPQSLSQEVPQSLSQEVPQSTEHNMNNSAKSFKQGLHELQEAQKKHQEKLLSVLSTVSDNIQKSFSDSEKITNFIESVSQDSIKKAVAQIIVMEHKTDESKIKNILSVLVSSRAQLNVVDKNEVFTEIDNICKEIKTDICNKIVVDLELPELDLSTSVMLDIAIKNVRNDIKKELNDLEKDFDQLKKNIIDIIEKENLSVDDKLFKISLKVA